MRAHEARAGAVDGSRREERNDPLCAAGRHIGLVVVRDTRIELVTSSVSGKRSPTELIARDMKLVVERATGIEPVCTALQAVASPLGHSTVGVHATCTFERMTGFEPATLTLAR